MILYEKCNTTILRACWSIFGGWRPCARRQFDCPAIDLSARQLCDLELLLNRGFYPLNGYMGQADYHAVLERMRLADGTVWPIPICLDVAEAVAARLQPGQRVALNDEEGFLLALLTVEEVWQPDRERRRPRSTAPPMPRPIPG
jgi:sulfate adenylyltransferase